MELCPGISLTLEKVGRHLRGSRVVLYDSNGYRNEQYPASTIYQIVSPGGTGGEGVGGWARVPVPGRYTMSVLDHFITFAMAHPANAGALILVGLLILWLIAMPK